MPPVAVAVGAAAPADTEVHKALLKRKSVAIVSRFHHYLLVVHSNSDCFQATHFDLYISGRNSYPQVPR